MARESSVIEEALERFRFAEESESEWRRQCLDDLRFAAGEVDGVSTQWNLGDLRAREQQKRPAITINRVGQFLKQVTNEGRQNNPSIRISPVDDGADITTAEVLQGIIRHIEVGSFADICRAVAREHMCSCGIGYTRLMTEFCNTGEDVAKMLEAGSEAAAAAWDLEIRFGPPILNPFSVYLDPGAQESDKSDGQFAFITSHVTEAQHNKLWPGKEVSSAEAIVGLGDSYGGWLAKDGIRIAEYFSREVKKRTLAQIETAQDGQPLFLVGFRDEFDAMVKNGTMRGFRVTREREVEFPTILHRKINAVAVLEETTWPGMYIPIIPYIGEESLIEGRRSISGLVRAAKPAHQMYNFWVTALTEMIATAPKSPWMVAVAGLAGLQQHWDAAAQQTRLYLPYNHLDENGNPIPPPQRQNYEPPIQAITHAILQADRDMKACYGIYEAGLGQRGPQESGRAIQARKVESDVATYHMIDNESRARRFEGKQILDLIPRVYDRPRVMRIIGMDETPSTVTVNSENPVKFKGKEQVFDLKAGKYDVTVDVGPGFQTKRQQAAEALSGLVRAYPEIMQTAGDLVVKAQDFPYAQEIAERLKPAGIDDEQQQIPPAVQQQMVQSQQMIDALTQRINELTDDLKAKTAELESKERIAAADNQTKLLIAELQAETQKMIAGMKAEMDAHKAEMQAHMTGMKTTLDAKLRETEMERARESGDAERKVKLAVATSKNGKSDE